MHPSVNGNKSKQSNDSAGRTPWSSARPELTERRPRWRSTTRFEGGAEETRSCELAAAVPLDRAPCRVPPMVEAPGCARLADPRRPIRTRQIQRTPPG